VKVALLGATGGMGRALARQMVERGDSLCVLGRDATELERAAQDLKARGSPAATISSALCDLEKPEGFRKALDIAEDTLQGLDVIVVTAAVFATQEQLETDRELAQKLLTVDFANTVVFCEEARLKLLSRGGGTLCVFSSVAGDRGRKPEEHYRAAKARLSAYLEGLDHRFRRDGLKTVCVKPGFVRTAMTEGVKVPPFAGEPDEVARTVLAGIDAGSPVVYAPPVWKWVMTAIKAMPRFAMRRVGF
jgi:short-subunit dehydrogenase